MIYNTIQRKVILDFLNNNKDKQFTVEEISEKIREVYNGVDEIPGKSTVYRIISKLVDEGEVKRFVKGKSRQFLYHISGCENQVTHLHLKCVECGKLFHLDTTISDKITNQILKTYNFNLDLEKNCFIWTMQ